MLVTEEENSAFPKRGVAEERPTLCSGASASLAGKYEALAIVRRDFTSFPHQTT
jgi:hypothetical protein